MKTPTERIDLAARRMLLALHAAELARRDLARLLDRHPAGLDEDAAGWAAEMPGWGWALSLVTGALECALLDPPGPQDAARLDALARGLASARPAAVPA